MFQLKKRQFFASIDINSPGGSFIYDKRKLSHLEIGLGLNLNQMEELYNNVRASAYIDVRPFFLWRKNILIKPIDLGWSYYSGKEPKNGSIDRNGFYSSLGVANARLITKRGMGPFISIIWNSYIEQHHLNNPNLGSEARDSGVYKGLLQMSLGWKF